MKGFDGVLKTNEPLAPYVAYRIGGPARFLLLPENERDIERCFAFATEEQLEVVTLGSGSNVLVRDGGLNAVVLYLGHGLPGDIVVLEKNGDSELWGVPCHWTKARLLDESLRRSMSGLEFSAGIPGTIGGAVFMNAGTKWGSYSEVIERVHYFSPAKGFFAKGKDELNFSYREHGDPDIDEGALVVSVDLRVHKSADSDEPRRRVDEILSYRGGKQPLELPNCGSVFKNPENSERGAGRLIEACRLKGTRIGGAEISQKHANFILNRDRASSDDVEALIALCQEKVYERFGVHLETEVRILGNRHLASD